MSGGTAAPAIASGTLTPTVSICVGRPSDDMRTKCCFLSGRADYEKLDDWYCDEVDDKIVALCQVVEYFF